MISEVKSLEIENNKVELIFNSTLVTEISLFHQIFSKLRSLKRIELPENRIEIKIGFDLPKYDLLWLNDVYSLFDLYRNLKKEILRNDYPEKAKIEQVLSHQNMQIIEIPKIISDDNLGYIFFDKERNELVIADFNEMNSAIIFNVEKTFSLSIDYDYDTLHLIDSILNSNISSILSNIHENNWRFATLFRIATQLPDYWGTPPIISGSLPNHQSLHTILQNHSQDFFQQDVLSKFFQPKEILDYKSQKIEEIIMKLCEIERIFHFYQDNCFYMKRT